MKKNLRSQFPLLQADNELVYLDNAATTQTPSVVLDEIYKYYTKYRANIHRGIYDISEHASGAYEQVREIVARFIGADDISQIIFTRGTTESINLVAHGWAETHVQKGDEILVSELEHHSNFVPWYEVCKKTGAQMKIISLSDDFTLDMDAYARMLSKKVKLVCVTAISNVTGTTNDISTITRMAHEYGAKVLVDGAQGVAHRSCDVEKDDMDFFAFSGHKMYGPTGVGVLYGKPELLASMDPFLYGGGMVDLVSLEEVTYRDVPTRFEGGTPPIAQVIGLGAAVQFIETIGIQEICNHERMLSDYAHEKLSKIDGLTLFHPVINGSSILSFSMKGIHPHDIAAICNTQNIAIRAGHHCAQPLMKRLGVSATARISFGIYNTKEDIDALILALHAVQEKFI
ncbi:MAG: SufS family cysteine desulfurase [bacterium]|nr:SufS family cysteine desulfurase [bacterium]